MKPRRPSLIPVAAVATLAGLAAALGSGRAVAADPAKGAMPTIEIASDVETGEPRPAAPDQRTGHLYFGGSAGVTGVAGAVATNTSSMSVAGTGATFGGFIGVGIARYATLQIFGDRTLFAGPAVCTGTACAGSAFTVGMGLTYHVAQALAFDPWGSFGVAYRQSVFAPDPMDPSMALRKYQGIDVARIAFGGDFYPTRFFGFGPFIEADFGTNFLAPPPMNLPPGVVPGPTAYAMFQLGVRVAFDPLRSGSASPAKKAGRRPSAPSIGLASPSFGASRAAAPGF